MIGNRKDVLTALLEFDSDLNTLREQVLKLEWDGEEQIQCLPRQIREALEEYLAGTRSSQEMEQWANLIEGRDDIEIASNLNAIIFELANPLITTSLSIQRAHVLIGTLNE